MKKLGDDGLLKQNVKTFSTFDSNLIRREYYNGYMDPKLGKAVPNKFNVRFDRIDLHLQYIMDAGKNPGPKYVILRPDEFCFLPHAFYTITGILENGQHLPVGEPIQLIMNLEKSMFKGNKTPSNQFGFGE